MATEDKDVIEDNARSQFTLTRSVTLPPSMAQDIKDAMLHTLKNPELIRQALSEYVKENPEAVRGILMQVLLTERKKNQIVKSNPTLEWITANSLQLDKYGGKYVAIKDGEILGSGDTSSEARAQARQKKPGSKVTIMLISNSDFGL